MSHLSICDLAGRSIRNINAELELGLHVVLSLDKMGSEELVPLLDGSTKPRHGRVHIDGRCPYACPEMRRHIGSLWATEYLPKAPTIEQSLRAMQLEAGALEGARAMLQAFGVNSDLTRPTAMLDQNSTRLLALAIALSKPNPLALLLSEPFLVTSRSAHPIISEHITRCASSIPVLVITSSQSTAQRLGGASAELAGGFWRRSPRDRSELVTLRISGQSMRALAAEVVRGPRVHTLHMTSHVEGYDELWLETNDPTGVSLDVVRSAQQLGVRIWSLETHAGIG